MPTEADPIIGQWYHHLDKGQEFQVISVDEVNGMIETQHVDGDVEEIPADDWYEMDVEPVAAPEDWNGPIDDAEFDDDESLEDVEDVEEWDAAAEDDQQETELWASDELVRDTDDWQEEF